MESQACVSLPVVRIQRFSTGDGPGVRTTVFLQGCPLSCVWCHNPETQSAQPVLLTDPASCIGCGACTAVCTAGNLTEFNFRKVHTLVRRGEYQGAYEEMNKCMLCGKCRLVCPRGINTRGVVMLIKRKLGDF